jgi:predicted dehydrogenase
MLKVAIVGCGKIADSHALQILRIRGCEIVGACDNEELMAKQFFDRFPVKRYFSSLTQLLEEARPDVVHITTPPQSHFEIGRRCLEHGCHIFVEKPFTLDVTEAEKLVALANQKRLRLTVGHDAQFSHVARRMRKLVEDGFLGGAPIHMESYWCYNFGNATYAKALLGDKQHWVRRLPGNLLQNIISHGIAKIAEFLTSESPTVMAHGFSSPFLRTLGEDQIVDELRVIISEERSTTAYFTFSSQMRPSLHQFRAFGPTNGVLIDEDQQILIQLPSKKLKSYAENFFQPVNFACRYLKNSLRNMRLFLASDFHPDAGKKYLFECFYRSITEGAPVPIPYREILLTARIMDAIFEQIDVKREDHLEINRRRESPTLIKGAGLQ